MYKNFLLFLLFLGILGNGFAANANEASSTKRYSVHHDDHYRDHDRRHGYRDYWRCVERECRDHRHSDDRWCKRRCSYYLW
jgi:hypothetical protein